MWKVATAAVLSTMALCISATARADETQDLAICVNATAITDRDAPPQERLVACSSLIKMHEAKPQASDFYNRATVYSALNRPKDALADLDTALKISAPDDVLRGNYYLDRAADMLLAGLRTPEAALADATAAIEIISARGARYNSGFAEELARAYFWRGGAYAEREDKVHAAADFKKALSYDVKPEQREVMVKLMTALGYPPN